MLDAKRFFDARSGAAGQERLGFAVGGVSADQDDARAEFRAIQLDPLVNVGTIDVAGHANVGNDAAISFGGELMESFGAGGSLNDAIAFAFERGANEGADGRLIFDQKNGSQVQDWLRAVIGQPPWQAASAVSVAMGRRTTKVLPLSPSLFQQRISPPWARTMP